MSPSEDDIEFADFFRSHDGRLRSYLVGLGAPPDLVDEIAPFAFMALLRHWVRLRTQNPRAYLFTIGRNALYKKIGPYRQRLDNYSKAAIDALRLSNVGPEGASIDPLVLIKLIDQLSPRQQQVTNFRYFQGLSIEETAAMMDLSIGAVKSLTHRATAALGRTIKDQQNEEED